MSGDAMECGCHYCSGNNRYKPWSVFLCSGCRKMSESRDVVMSYMKMEELNAELQHQEEVKKVFDKIKETL
jgi:hypothetical protein